jgi:hypothetical protein
MNEKLDSNFTQLGYFYNSLEDYKAGRPSRVGILYTNGTYLAQLLPQYRLAKLTPIIPEDEATILRYIKEERAVVRFDFAEACEHAEKSPEERRRYQQIKDGTLPKNMR